MSNDSKKQKKKLNLKKESLKRLAAPKLGDVVGASGFICGWSSNTCGTTCMCSGGKPGC